MKKHLTRLLAALTALSLCVCIPVCAAESSFSDVPEDIWYAEAVDYAHENGLMEGTGDGLFSPDGTASRAMLVAILYRQAGSPEVTEPAAFSDVEAGAWYADAVSWGAANSIVSGLGDGRFGPDDPLTREQIATLLWRYAGSPESSGEDFADESSISGFASAAVDWARTTGVVSGSGNNIFDPRSNATRAQLAQFLMNWLTLDQEETPGTPEENPGTPEENPGSQGKTLVACYSATGTTQAVAETVADILGADLFVITPVEPYTDEDLDWNSDSSRVVREHSSPESRHVELVTVDVPEFDSYDTVFIGYPIWWGGASWAVNDFVTENDFTGKTVIPFCTSMSSPLGSSAADLAELAGTGNWQEGHRFGGGTTASEVEEWLDSLDLEQAPAAE